MKKSTSLNAKQTFSKNISVVRRVKNISQEKLAEDANLHRTYVGRMERGDVTPTLDTAERVAHALGLELWEVLQPDFSLDVMIRRDT